VRRGRLVAAGLFAAWAAHDLEELFTMEATSREMASRAPAWLPVPADVRRDGYSRRHLRTGIAAMAVVVAAAAVDGVRTDGRSPAFRTVLQGFGWHGVGHLALTALTGRYVSGVATSPVVVVPYWLWARRELARAGAPLETSGLASALAVPPVILGALAAARVLTRQSNAKRPVVSRPRQTSTTWGS
jgi:hypothetical protein